MEEISNKTNLISKKMEYIVTTIWETFYDYFQGDEYKMTVYGLLFVSNFVFFFLTTILSIIDCTGEPKFFTQYSVQTKRRFPVDKKSVMKTFSLVLFNQLIVASIFIPLAFRVLKWRGMRFSKELPTFQQAVIHIIFFSLIEEIFFYYSHRLLHHPRIYKYIHKIHHEWQAPISITALYAHPFEHLISNLLPGVIGPLILGSHIFLLILWFVVALMSTILSHMGYHLPFLYSPEYHDFHHLKFTDNYGVFGILDWFHGTDKLFKKHIAYKRHKILLGFKPMTTLVPDEKAY